MFVLFLAYTVFVFLRHKNQESSLGVKFHRIVNELAYTHLFFFIGVILCHVLTPKDFQVLLIYIYVFTLVGDVFATLQNKGLVNKIFFWVQSAVLAQMYVFLMGDNWCRFYLYRGHA